MKTLPGAVTSLIDVPQYEEMGEFPVERGYIWTVAASVENANPLYWDDEVAEEVTGGVIAPPTMISAWQRPHLGINVAKGIDGGATVATGSGVLNGSINCDTCSRVIGPRKNDRAWRLCMRIGLPRWTSCIRNTRLPRAEITLSR